MRKGFIYYCSALFFSTLISSGFGEAETNKQNTSSSLTSNNRTITLLERAAKKKKKNKNKDKNKNNFKKACSSVSRVGFGVLYKPAADASDSRRGKPAVLFQGSQKPRTSAINIYDSGGNAICRFTFKASSIPGVNGGSDHYFSGWSGGCGKTGSQIAAAAKKSGSTNIFIQTSGKRCLGPINPVSRTGGIG